MCWGSNTYGQLGSNITPRSLVPIQVQGVTEGATSLSVHDSNTCAVVNGAALCWGSNLYGYLGNNSTVSQSADPVQVQGLTAGVTQISAGYYHACAIASIGLKCWGYNDYGQLGNGTTTTSKTPVTVQGFGVSP
jgi:alpha-tubulin suppressor-like RCC1 family protein